MSDWGIVVPEGVTNLCVNPSFELGTTGWTTGGTNTLVVSNAQSKFGAYAAKWTFDSGAAIPDHLIASYAITLPLPNTVYKISSWVYVPSASTWPALHIAHLFQNFAGSSSVINLNWTASDSVDVWGYIESTLTVAADITGNICIYTPQTPPGDYVFYIDANLFEQSSEASAYIDGDQPGCSWSGTPHASTSNRSAVSRAGGVVKDLKDDYGFGVAEILGAGTTPLTVGVKGYSFLPGGVVSGIKVNPRQFSLVGTLKGSGADCDLHAARQALAKELAHNRYPKDDEGWQPVRIRYTGADVEKEIAAHYAGGLEAAIKLEDKIHEKVALRFVADDPMWYGLGESKGVLAGVTTLAVRYIAGRVNSIWDDLNLTVNGGAMYAITVDLDGDQHIYAGGGFAQINAVANTCAIAEYDPITDAWSALGTGAANNTVRAIVIGPDGTLYAAGDFTQMGGIANTSRIAKWNGTVWTAMGTGAANNSVYTLAFGPDGSLYAGGSFTQMGGVANTSRIAKWDGTNWTALNVGANGEVDAIVVRPSDGRLFAAGDFTSIGGVSVGRIAQWDGTNWSVLVSAAGANVIIRALKLTKAGNLVAGGAFTTIDGESISYIALWNGTSWSAIGNAPDSFVYGLDITTNQDTLFAIGGFSEIGGVPADGAARWHGAGWLPLDIVLPAGATVQAIGLGVVNPVTAHLQDYYIGFSNTGNATVPGGKTTVTNDGSTVAFPRIIISRSGGTSARLTGVYNETSGKCLYFNYSLLDGETLTIDLKPTQKSIVSSFFGDRMDAILTGSDFGTFCLLPGDNDITCFVAESGSPTVTATMIWKNTYLSFD